MLFRKDASRRREYAASVAAALMIARATGRRRRTRWPLQLKGFGESRQTIETSGRSAAAADGSGGGIGQGSAYATCGGGEGY